MTTLETALSDIQQLAARIAAVERTVAGAGERIAAVERNLEALGQRANTLQGNVAADLQEFEQTLQAQAGAIHSARTAMSQTDGLVERVVEALELLQASVFDESWDHLAAAN
ncbi:MAG: hypothetical protein LAP87_02210 [Acidobacteriia bacterium]|nr:hypothetical protein [Terriglobia bacterium]